MDSDVNDIRLQKVSQIQDVAKDFLAWHSVKQVVHDSCLTRPFYHEREVWWCRVGLNIGFESDGKGQEYMRPVLVLKGISLHIFIEIPITTKNKMGKHRIFLDLKDGVDRQAIISQIRSFDSKRLWKKMAVVDRKNFTQIQQAVIDMFR